MENDAKFVGHIEGYFQLSSKDKVGEYINLWQKHGAQAEFDESSNRLHIKCSIPVFETLPPFVKSLLTTTHFS